MSGADAVHMRGHGTVPDDLCIHPGRDFQPCDGPGCRTGQDTLTGKPLHIVSLCLHVTSIASLFAALLLLTSACCVAIDK